MRKIIEHNTKAERRALKKRPKMPVHGRRLKQTNKHAGLAAIKAK